MCWISKICNLQLNKKQILQKRAIKTLSGCGQIQTLPCPRTWMKIIFKNCFQYYNHNEYLQYSKWDLVLETWKCHIWPHQARKVDVPKLVFVFWSNIPLPKIQSGKPQYCNANPLMQLQILSFSLLQKVWSTILKEEFELIVYLYQKCRSTWFWSFPLTIALFQSKTLNLFIQDFHAFFLGHTREPKSHHQYEQLLPIFSHH